MTTKNQHKKLVKDLERLFRHEKTPYPVKIKNTIYVGYFGVNKQANGLYKVFNLNDKTMLHQTYSKPAAIALAKIYATNYTSFNVKKVLDLDDQYSKHCIDELFYNNTIENSKDLDKLEVAEIRLDITRNKIEELEQKLNIMVLRNY